MPWPGRSLNIRAVNRNTRTLHTLLVAVTCVLSQALGQAETVEELANEIRNAYSLGDAAKAVKLATDGIQKHPDDTTLLTLRGRIHEEENQHAKAEADYTTILKKEPNSSGLYHRRGVVRFFQLKFDVSLADFDKFIEMVPGQEPYHWQRGLVHYYAGKYKAGRKQFEVHQTVNTQDVENAVWHYLCVAKTDGVAEAEKHFIKITSDRRVPLKQIHALFAGKGTEQQVLDAIKAGNPGPGALARNQFYGHLYLGLYFESQGKEEKSAKYIALSAKGHESHGYMGQVARVHHEWLQQKAKRKPTKKKSK